jgi:hypothetical protein
MMGRGEMFGEVIAQISGARGPIHVELSLFGASLDPIKRMAMALDHLCFTNHVTMTCTVELSVSIGVAGCGCLTSSNVTWMGTLSCEHMNVAPSSASTTDDMMSLMCLMMVDTVEMGPLFCLPAFDGCVHKKRCPPALLCAWEADRYDVSLWMCSIMSEVEYMIVASRCVTH